MDNIWESISKNLEQGPFLPAGVVWQAHTTLAFSSVAALACLLQFCEIESLRGIRHPAVRTAPAFEKRTRHDHRFGVCAQAVRHSACRVEVVSGRSGVALARALSLAIRETQGRSSDLGCARTRGIQRFELHARHRRESLP